MSIFDQNLNPKKNRATLVVARLLTIYLLG